MIFANCTLLMLVVGVSMPAHNPEKNDNYKNDSVYTVTVIEDKHLTSPQ